MYPLPLKEGSGKDVFQAIIQNLNVKLLNLHAKFRIPISYFRFHISNFQGFYLLKTVNYFQKSFPM
ncbi:MAG: hypothetical protein CMF36_03245 [Leeuwenhoekiella sp.]|nr:hypothetical protein [Leeuwenhoekiella sp.]MBA80131.1 hypothetical protein [Leeuwenhoekiella sp.]